MSNSPLVSYTRLSKNCTHPRKHAIDTITIHCYVGQVTAKRGCDNFATTTRQVSSNYVVGYDGAIGLSVDEADRAWTSGGKKNGQVIRVNGMSGGDNDHRAVTIEVACSPKHPYEVKPEAYEALIALVADICKRNGIKKLLWQGKKSLVGKVDQQNMTVHRWFAQKACPGDWLYSRHGEIAERVNALLGVETIDTEPVETVDTEPVEKPVPAVDNKTAIWNYLKGKGLNDYAVAGIMGNIQAESGFKPTNLQGYYEKKLGYTDDTYTDAVDNGSYTNFVQDKAGYGLVQWTYWSRKQALLDFSRKQGKSIGDLTMQLDFMWQEMQGYKSMMETLTNATSVKEASTAVMLKYERPANQSEANQQKRADLGQTVYDMFVKPVDTALYSVQIGAFTKQLYAITLLAKAETKGFHGLVKWANERYKVQIGAYSVKANAETELARLKEAGFVNSFITTSVTGLVVATDTKAVE